MYPVSNVLFPEMVKSQFIILCQYKSILKLLQASGVGVAQTTVSPEVQQWFNTVDKDRSGKINAKELQSALVNGQGRNFSDTACELMIGMFDKDKSGTVDALEFQQLYTYINQWLGVFRNYDRDQSGHIEEAELAQGKTSCGSDAYYVGW